MRDEHLERLFAELPSHRASEGFTRSVIDAIEAGHASRPSGVRSGWMAAAAMIVVATGTGFLVQEHRQQQQIEAFERQRNELKAELAALQQQADFDPVVEIGQEDGVQYILDLRPIEVQPVRTAALDPRFD